MSTPLASFYCADTEQMTTTPFETSLIDDDAATSRTMDASPGEVLWQSPTSEASAHDSPADEHTGAAQVSDENEQHVAGYVPTSERVVGNATAYPLDAHFAGAASIEYEDDDTARRAENGRREELLAPILHACARIKRLSSAEAEEREQLTQTFSCDLCHRTLHQPVSLACGNNFCEGCLFHYLDNSLTIHRVANPAFDALLDVALQLTNIGQQPQSPDQAALTLWMMGYVLSIMPRPMYTCPHLSCSAIIRSPPIANTFLRDALDYVLDAGVGVPPPSPLHPIPLPEHWSRFLLYLQ